MNFGMAVNNELFIMLDLESEVTKTVPSVKSSCSHLFYRISAKTRTPGKTGGHKFNLIMMRNESLTTGECRGREND